MSAAAEAAAARAPPPGTEAEAEDELGASAAKRAKTTTDETETEEDPVAKLRALPTIRERCRRIYEAAKRDELAHFSLHEDKLPAVADYVDAVIQERFGAQGGVAAVPNHSRYRHFEPGGVDRLSELRAQCEAEGVDDRELARRLVDLVVVSVLLDAGAGDRWRYEEGGTGQTLGRSEGLGVASFHMFMAGAFSSDPDLKLRADAKGLQALTTEAIREGFQVDDETNPLVGAEGRAELLRSLGQALELHPEFFSSALAEGNGEGKEAVFRPGYLVDYLYAKADPGTKEVPIHALWHVVMAGLESIWPAGRTAINGRDMGDVWPHAALQQGAAAADGKGDKSAGFVPFHKLSQWLTYSLMEPLADPAGLVLTETEHMTGLPEYRNGGLFVDMGVLVPNNPEAVLPPAAHKPDSEVIVEWRALTVVLLDEVAALLRAKSGASEAELPLVKVLEGGTWTAGRKVAKEKRPETCGPPIVIVSDGTVF